MLTAVRHFLGEAKLWGVVGTVLVTSGFVTAYVAEHRLAETVLAEKARIPAPVIVQGFRSETHANEMSEVSLIGEVDFSQARVVESRSGEQVFLLPVYGVSAGGLYGARLRMYEVMGQGIVPSDHRPVPRRSVRAEPTTSVVFAYRLSVARSAPTMLDELGLHELGEGFHGTLVHAEGKLVAQDAGLLIGIEEVAGLPVVAPLPKRRSATVLNLPVSNVATLQVALGVMFLTIAIALRVFGPITLRPSSSKGPNGPTRAPARSVPPSQFAPIASQDEIATTSANDRRVGAADKLFSRASRLIRNRR